MQNNGIENGWRSLKDQPEPLGNQRLGAESWKPTQRVESTAYKSSFNSEIPDYLTTGFYLDMGLTPRSWAFTDLTVNLTSMDATSRRASGDL